jgi:hypothetical protein
VARDAHVVVDERDARHQRRDRRDDQRDPDRGAQPLDVQAGRDRRGAEDDRAVERQRRETEGRDRQRQREPDQGRPQQRVEEADQRRGQECDAQVGDLDVAQQRAGEEERGRRGQPGDGQPRQIRDGPRRP